MTEPRRVRTQAERAADGQAWRTGDDMIAALNRAARLIASQPPQPARCHMHRDTVRWLAARYAAKPPTYGDPSAAFGGIPVIEDIDLPYGEWRLLDADGQVLKQGNFFAPHPPRRRWWHRLTRRNP